MLLSNNTSQDGEARAFARGRPSDFEHGFAIAGRSLNASQDGFVKRNRSRTCSQELFESHAGLRERRHPMLPGLPLRSAPLARVLLIL